MRIQECIYATYPSPKNYHETNKNGLITYWTHILQGIKNHILNKSYDLVGISALHGAITTTLPIQFIPNPLMSSGLGDILNW